MFCFHKYDVPENRFQVCLKCGKVRVVECAHVFTEFKNYSIKNSNSVDKYIVEYIYVLKCKNCGELKTYNIRPD